MDNKCILCGNNRGNRKLYCSEKCNKKSWNIKHRRFLSYNNQEEFLLTESGIGFKWEKHAADLLGATHLLFNHSGNDLDWKGKSVDVKACELYKRKRHHKKPTKNIHGVWVFNRNKIKKTDFFFVFV